MNKADIAKIITGSTLWNTGKDGHNALSEIVETLYDMVNNYVETLKTDNSYYFSQMVELRQKLKEVR